MPSIRCLSRRVVFIMLIGWIPMAPPLEASIGTSRSALRSSWCELVRWLTVGTSAIVNHLFVHNRRPPRMHTYFPSRLVLVAGGVAVVRSLSTLCP